MVKILDCTPAMADVISGASPHPRERRARENAFQWLKGTPAMKRLEREFPEFARRWPTIAHRPDIKPPASSGLADFPHRYLMIWEKAPGAHCLLLCVNEDGTRCALADPVELLVDVWQRLQQSPGRPQAEHASAKTLAQRRWRAKQAAK